MTDQDKEIRGIFKDLWIECASGFDAKDSINKAIMDFRILIAKDYISKAEHDRQIAELKETIATERDVFANPEGSIYSPFKTTDSRAEGQGDERG